jgi:hypothetical protein
MTLKVYCCYYDFQKRADSCPSIRSQPSSSLNLVCLKNFAWQQTHKLTLVEHVADPRLLVAIVIYVGRVVATVTSDYLRLGNSMLRSYCMARSPLPRTHSHLGSFTYEASRKCTCSKIGKGSDHNAVELYVNSPKWILKF